MPDPQLLLLIGLTFLVAGCVKGIVGFGLPTVALALLAASVGIKPAIALTVFPALLTNVWQALAGGHLRQLMVRLLPLIVAVFAGVFVGTQILAIANPAWLTLFLGLLLCLYAAVGLANVKVPLLGRHEKWAAPFVGVINGTVTGLTGTFIMPGVLYLQSLGLERAQLVQAMGLLFLLSTAALGAFLVNVSLMPAQTALTSLFAVVPAFVGMWAGRRIGAALNDAMFARMFFGGLGGVGFFLAGRSFLVLSGA